MTRTHLHTTATILAAAVTIAGCKTTAKTSGGDAKEKASELEVASRGWPSSELTANADRVTALAEALASGEEVEFPYPTAEVEEGAERVRASADVKDATHRELAGFSWQVFFTTTSSEAAKRSFQASLLLTPDGLFVNGLSSGMFPVKQGPEIEGMREALARLSGAIRAGQINDVTMTLSQCEAAVGKSCVLENVYQRLSRPPGLDLSLLEGDITSVHVMRLGPVYRQDDGRIVAAIFKARDGEDGAVRFDHSPLLKLMTNRFHMTPPPEDAPADLTAGPSTWSLYCERDWPRVSDVDAEVTRRCMAHLLSLAYGKPLTQGRFTDDEALAGEPRPGFAAEVGLSSEALEAIRAHVGAVCEGDAGEQSACARVGELITAQLARKTSLTDDGELGSFAPLMEKVLAGQALTKQDLFLDQVERSWSMLTLEKLDTALYARHGFLVADPDLARFFYEKREEQPTAGLPLERTDGGQTSPFSEIDRKNKQLLSLAQRSRTR